MHLSPGREKWFNYLSILFLKKCCTNLQKSEEDHGLVQHLLHLLIAQTLHPLLQLVVDEEREELRTPLVQVEEVLKVAGDDLRIIIKSKIDLKPEKFRHKLTCLKNLSLLKELLRKLSNLSLSSSKF